jgi:myo-inositol-1(or 4)-monophosphatase
MTPAALKSRYLAAQAIAVEAGRLARGFLADPARLNIEMKGPQDFVSAADRATEQLIAQRLAAAFPEDAFLGEESGRAVGSEQTETLWVVDPIDGTANFVRGLPDWCVSIGLLQAGRPELGAIYCPATDELYAGRRGHGAFCNGRPIRVSNRTDMAGATIALEYSFATPSAVHGAQIAAVHARGGEYRRNGSGAVSLSRVADGRFDGFVEMLINIWDVLAGIVLVEEAGGWVSDFLGEGGMSRAEPLVAATPGMRDALLAVASSGPVK